MAEKQKTTTVTILQSTKDRLQELVIYRGGRVGRTADLAILEGLRVLWEREGVAGAESAHGPHKVQQVAG